MTTLKPVTRIEQFLSDIIDQGGGGGGSGGASALIVHMDEQTNTLDKTWQEIHDAAPLVWMDNNGVYYPMVSCVVPLPGIYGCLFVDIINRTQYAFSADSPDGYPVYRPDESGDPEA